ncbi:MAG TPA: PRC-barrel domain-containing protein [Stellaceae bacterium]|jgi:hypothetical protein|nr:PRC-barrel domain-containing protein [Stellaceae bacterium]
MNYTTNVGERGFATEETPRLIASDKVEGTAVFDRDGNHLGRIHHLMIDKYSGQVAYAIASFGGFLGVGENWVPLPWKALSYQTQVAGYVVDVDRPRLEKAPRYASTSDPNWSDRAYTKEIDQYWFPPL